MRVLDFLRRTPCAALLGVQMLGVLLYPFFEETLAGRSLFALFGLLVLALAILAIRATPGLTWVATTLALPVTVLLLVIVFTQNEDLLPWASGFEAALYFYAAGAMLMYMLDDEHVTLDELFAIGAVFTLVAWAFAHTFVVLQGLDHEAFGGERTWTELLFLSFTTLSSTGLSDIVPITGHARSVVMLEQVAGLFYIAMVVTRLVSLNSIRRPQQPR